MGKIGNVFSSIDSSERKKFREDKKAKKDVMKSALASESDVDKIREEKNKYLSEKAKIKGEKKKLKNEVRNKKVAARKGFEDITDDEGKTISAEDQAQALRDTRKAKAKTYLRNFASQLTKGSNETPKSKETRDDFLEALQNQRDANKKAEENIYKDKFKQMANDITNTVDTESEDNSKMMRLASYGDNNVFGKGGNVNFDKWVARNDDGSVSFDNFMKSKEGNPMNKIEPDSNPTSFMKKEFLKRRGY